VAASAALLRCQYDWQCQPRGAQGGNPPGALHRRPKACAPTALPDVNSAMRDGKCTMCKGQSGRQNQPSHAADMLSSSSSCFPAQTARIAFSTCRPWCTLPRGRPQQQRRCLVPVALWAACRQDHPCTLLTKHSMRAARSSLSLASCTPGLGARCSAPPPPLPRPGEQHGRYRL